jgi:hypothetical protein
MSASKKQTPKARTPKPSTSKAAQDSDEEYSTFVEPDIKSKPLTVYQRRFQSDNFKIGSHLLEVKEYRHKIFDLIAQKTKPARNKPPLFATAVVNGHKYGTNYMLYVVTQDKKGNDVGFKIFPLNKIGGKGGSNTFVEMRRVTEEIYADEKQQNNELPDIGVTIIDPQLTGSKFVNAAYPVHMFQARFPSFLTETKLIRMASNNHPIYDGERVAEIFRKVQLAEIRSVSDQIRLNEVSVDKGRHDPKSEYASIFTTDILKAVVRKTAEMCSPEADLNLFKGTVETISEAFTIGTAMGHQLNEGDIKRVVAAIDYFNMVFGEVGIVTYERGKQAFKLSIPVRETLKTYRNLLLSQPDLSPNQMSHGPDYLEASTYWKDLGGQSHNPNNSFYLWFSNLIETGKVVHADEMKVWCDNSLLPADIFYPHIEGRDSLEQINKILTKLY